MALGTIWLLDNQWLAQLIDENVALDDSQDFGLLVRSWCRLNQSSQLDLLQLILVLAAALPRLFLLQHFNGVWHAHFLEAKGWTLMITVFGNEKLGFDVFMQVDIRVTLRLQCHISFGYVLFRLIVDS